MDYEFRKDLFSGEYRASFSMEHQIIGRWLEHEILRDRTKIAQILALLEKGEAAPFSTLSWLGKEISLSIHDHEVQLEENGATGMDLSDIDEEFSLYEAESQAACGIEDFRSVLLQWAEFVRVSLD